MEREPESACVRALLEGSPERGDAFVERVLRSPVFRREIERAHEALLATKRARGA